jgi:orotate phosphoribosyltransferase
MSTDADASQDFLRLVTARQGHFQLESGHHGALWLDLDGLFVEPARVAPLVNRLAAALREYDLAAVCGPLVGGAFLAQSVSAALDVEFLFSERVMPARREGLYQAEYRLPTGLRGRTHEKRIAIVDDVISAGSAARGTYADLQAQGARPVVVGALLMLGALASSFFEERGVPLTSVARMPYDIWLPAACPLCISGAPLERDLS